MGGGHVFQYYLAACDESELEIVAICDSDQNRLKNLPHGIWSTQNIDEFLSFSQVDAVIVATPTKTHFDVARRVISSGKPLVIEKPAGLSNYEFDDLRGFCIEKNLPAFVLMHATYGLELERGRALLHNHLNSQDRPCLSWHASLFDPYETDENAQASLVNSWVDSGINALSTILSVLPGAELTHLTGSWTPKGVKGATNSAVQCYAFEGSCSGMAVIETNWCQGISHKSSRVILGSDLMLEFGHSDEQLTIVTKGQKEVIQYSSDKPRMRTHYERAFADAISHISNGRSNWHEAERAHRAYFEGF